MIIFALIVVSCMVGWFAYAVKKRHGGMWGSGVFALGCAWAWGMGLAQQVPGAEKLVYGIEEIALASLPPSLLIFAVLLFMPKAVPEAKS